MIATPSEDGAHLRRAYVLLLVAQIALGSGGIFGRFALQNMGAITVAAWRLVLVTVPLLVRAAWRRIHGQRGVAGQQRHLFVAGAVLALQFACWLQSLAWLSVGTSTLLVCTAPLWNGLYEVVILRRPLPQAFWWALTVALAGIGLIIHASPDNDPSPDNALLGVVLALTAGMSMAAYLLLMRRAAQAAQRQGTYDSLHLLAAPCTYAALLLLALSTQDPQPLPSPVHQWQAWAGVVGLAAVTQGIGHTLQNAALGQVRASLVGFATLLEPLVAAGLAALIFTETLQIQAIMGGLAVLGGLGWALWTTAPRGDGP